MDLALSYEVVAITPFLDHLNSRLALRTFIVGQSSTLGDLLCWAVLKRRDFSPEASHSSHPHVSRWFKFISSLPGATAVFSQGFL
jgi:glutathione S-transferase